MTAKFIHVVAAVICDADGNVLIAKRSADAHQGGLWEFPGGKVEQGELPTEALVRELQEELGIVATQYHSLIQIHHEYPDKSVFLDVWKVTRFKGSPRGVEGQPVQWVPAVELNRWQFPAANTPIIQAAQLPMDYVITHDLACAEEISSFLLYVEKVLEQGYRLLQLRTKSLVGDIQGKVIQRVLALCVYHDAVLMLNSDLECELESDLNCKEKERVGLHLTGSALSELESKPEGYRFVAASCHNESDIRRAELLGLDFVTLSPVLVTCSHPDAQTLGWQSFSALVKRACVPVYALGGMCTDNRQQAIELGAQGIASISAYS